MLAQVGNPTSADEAVSCAQSKHPRRTHRVEKIKLLIDTFRKRDLMRDEVGHVLGYSPSGARKYIKDLREFGVIELARYVEGTATFLGYPVYKLTSDAQRVEDFLATVESNMQMPARGQGEFKAVVDPTRHFHIMQDDVQHAIRVSRVKVARDYLVTALFGAPRGQQGATA